MFIDDFEEQEEKERKYTVLIIYDISDNKHRYKIAKYLLQFGFRVQKSAFEARLTKKQYTRLVTGLEALILEGDNIRIYRLKGYEEIKVFGSKDYSVDDDVIII